MQAEQLNELGLTEEYCGVALPQLVRANFMKRPDSNIDQVDHAKLGLTSPGSRESATRLASTLRSLLVSVLRLESGIVGKYISEHDPQETFPYKPKKRDMDAEAQFHNLDLLVNFLFDSLYPSSGASINWSDPVVNLVKHAQDQTLKTERLVNPLEYTSDQYRHEPAILNTGFTSQFSTDRQSLTLQVFPQLYSRYHHHGFLNGASVADAQATIHQVGRRRDLDHVREIMSQSTAIKPSLRVVYLHNGIELVVLAGLAKTDIREGKQIEGIDLKWLAQPDAGVFLPLGKTKSEPLKRFTHDLLFQTR